MREIVLDLETTGLEVEKGNKIIEIGCVEIYDKIATDNILHIYINPEMMISEESTKIHGLTNSFLRNKPTFQEVIPQILNFIGDSPIVAHNAQFDVGFLNYELQKNGYPKLTNKVIDTLQLARLAYPNMYNSLDALCKRFGIAKEKRAIHGALIDSNLLAKVYYFLSTTETSFDCFTDDAPETEILSFTPIIIPVTEREQEDHMKIISMFHK